MSLLKAERRRTGLPAIFIALVLLVSNLMAVQVHRDVHHAASVQHGAGHWRRPYLSQEATGHCLLCDAASQIEPILPQQVGTVEHRALQPTRQGTAAMARIDAAPASHIWNSRAPPERVLPMA